MKKMPLIPITILSSILIINPTYAARNKAQQAAVEGSTFLGVTLAATAAAGPVGLLVGSVAAAFLAKQTKKSNDTQIQLEEAGIHKSNLETAIIEQDSKIRVLEAEAVQKLSFQIMFATGEDRLSAIDLQRVKVLAEHLKSNPQLNVTLNGHADPRGTEGYNNVLSQERAKAIESALKDLGVEHDRITSTGYGADFSTAVKGDLLSYKLDRRVDIEMDNMTGHGVDSTL